ncbi:MAG: hypothetical protein JWM73_2017 [Solirubrobacterales bacterium]|nr:hypothetical protein [Solirubrobacterales bacterium]
MEPKSPAVSCQSCERSWNSAAMAEGLRLLGACPRCGGTLKFAGDETGSAPQERADSRAAGAVAPHLVLGIPRR